MKAAMSIQYELYYAMRIRICIYISSRHSTFSYVAHKYNIPVIEDNLIRKRFIKRMISENFGNSEFVAYIGKFSGTFHGLKMGKDYYDSLNYFQVRWSFGIYIGHAIYDTKSGSVRHNGIYHGVYSKSPIGISTNYQPKSSYSGYSI